MLHGDDKIIFRDEIGIFMISADNVNAIGGAMKKWFIVFLLEHRSVYTIGRLGSRGIDANG